MARGRACLRGWGVAVKPSPCVLCSAQAGRKWLTSRGWTCAACLLPVECPKCGAVAKPGIERFSIGSAESDDYRLEQSLGYICPNRHVTFGPTQPGPSSLGLSGPMTVFDPERPYTGAPWVKP